MVAEAKSAYPGIDFSVGDATNLTYDKEFDAVSSNAVLHWVPEADKAAAGIVRSLKPGGRFVAEFGGKDNIVRIVNALYSILPSFDVQHPESLSPWYYPSIGEYATVLERNGFHISFAAHFDRMTPLSGQDGIRGWLTMFAGRFVNSVAEDRRQDLITAVEDKLRPALYLDGIWHADYKRIRIIAERVSA
jgi:trans-aconitate methyltransferase